MAMKSSSVGDMREENDEGMKVDLLVGVVVFSTQHRFDV